MSTIYEIAVNMEKEGKEYYERLASQTQINELQGVFLFMAKQEEKHRKLFESLAKGESIEPLTAQSAAAEAKAAFGRMAPGFSAPADMHTATDAYKIAKTMETQAVEYYTELLTKAQTTAEKEALEVVIKEEKQHEKIVASFLEFVNRPNEWLENAEFNHLESY